MDMNDFSAIDLLNKYNNGEISDSEFLDGFGKSTIYYSTPFGDHKDGGQKLFLLPAPNNTGYLPVFSSQERLNDFYQRLGRVGFVIMDGSFASVLETTKAINGKAPVKMGIIIDPGYFDITVDVTMLDAVIEMAKS